MAKDVEPRDGRCRQGVCIRAHGVLTVRDASEVLGVSRSFAYELVASGVLRSIWLGRRILIPPSAIDELFERPSPIQGADSRSSTGNG